MLKGLQGVKDLALECGTRSLSHHHHRLILMEEADLVRDVIQSRHQVIPMTISNPG